MSYLKYKGYLGTIEPDLETGELFGKLAVSVQKNVEKLPCKILQ